MAFVKTLASEHAATALKRQIVALDDDTSRDRSHQRWNSYGNLRSATNQKINRYYIEIHNYQIMGIDMTDSRKVFEEFDPNLSNSPKLKQIYIVDDDSDVRKSLHFRLSASDLSVWPFSAAADFLENLPFLKPAPILLDIRMPNMDGMQLLAILKERAVSWPVIILTAHGEVGIAVRAIKLGAIEFLEKPFAPEDLDRAIEQAFAILEQSERLHATRGEARERFGLLTGRETLTVAILMEGAPNKEVAQRLCLSVRTVEMHRGNALLKLNVKSIAEVVQLANIAGLTSQLELQSGKFNTSKPER